jgi:hypothetical protein
MMVTNTQALPCPWPNGDLNTNIDYTVRTTCVSFLLCAVCIVTAECIRNHCISTGRSESRCSHIKVVAWDVHERRYRTEPVSPFKDGAQTALFKYRLVSLNNRMA